MELQRECSPLWPSSNALSPCFVMMSNNLATRSKESEVLVKPGCKIGFVVLHRRMQRRSSRSEARAFSLVDRLN